MAEIFKTINVTISEQTHAKCQGYAAGDHIHNHNYSVRADWSQEARIRDLVKHAQKITQEDLERRKQIWAANNNLSTIFCREEGEEFIGTIWVLSCESDRNWRDDDDGADRLMGVLTDLINELQKKI